MNITIHADTLQPMIELCKKHKNHQMTKLELETMLSHEDYDVEFQRYMTEGLPVSNITKDHFIDYFMRINAIELDEITNPRLKDKHHLWTIFFSDIDYFVQHNNNLLPLSNEDLAYIEVLVTNAFPKKLLHDIGDIKCLFTLSIGNSMGYPYKNYIHFDFLNLGLVENKEVFLHFIAHEIHHIILTRIMNQHIKKPFSPLEYFLLSFCYEGLAVKCCNNGAGSLTKAIHKVKKNIGMNKDDFAFFKEEFPYMLKQFKTDFNTIKNEELTLEETDILIRKRWMNPRIKSFKDHSEQTLSHYRNYYLGMQIYGRMYDELGVDKMFDKLLDPVQLVAYIEEYVILDFD